MSSRPPLISVILPFKDAERWLDPALESMLRQQLRDFELIAIDDGSSDAGSERVERAASRGLTVKLLTHTSNLGIVSSLNHGLAVASGRYIARMDADDVSLPQRLKRQLTFLQETGVDLCGSWFCEFGQGLSRRVRWPSSEAAVHASLLFQNTICHPTLMARREVFETFEYREAYRLAEDYDLFVRAASRYRLANVPQVLFRYRRHPGQATQAMRSEMEKVTRRIRENAISAKGISATEEEYRLHHLIRAPQSIRSVTDLEGIESWLIKVVDHFDHEEAKQASASQWLRACVRAAPLGSRMWRLCRASPLYKASGANHATSIDLRALSLARLDYQSPSFAALRRLGVSA